MNALIPTPLIDPVRPRSAAGRIAAPKTITKQLAITFTDARGLDRKRQEAKRH